MKKNFTMLIALLAVMVNSVYGQDSWVSKSNFLGTRYNGWDHLGSFSIGPKGYMCTGRDFNIFDDFWEYDQATDVWTQRASYPGSPSAYSVGFSIGNKGYLGVGVTRAKDFWEYDPVLNTWKQKSSYPGNGNERAAGFSIGNKGYIGTGINVRRPIAEQWTNDFWEYDPAMDTWTRKADFAGTPRGAAASFNIGNKGYLGSGSTSAGIAIDFWAYDPATDSWMKKADFPVSLINPIAFSTDKNGYSGTGSKDNFWEYNPAANDWTQKTGLDFPMGSNVFAIGIGSKGYLLLDAAGAINGKNFWEYSPADGIVTDTTAPYVECLAPQVFCYSSTNNYSVPLLVANDISGIKSITYSITGATNRSGTDNNASGFFNPGVSIITWQVIDNAGNISICENNVRVDQPLTVAIPDVFPLLFWGDPNTLYIGYGPTDLTLTAMPSGGTKLPDGTYHYAWSNGATSNSISIHAVAAGSYNYSVTITDSLGCLSGVTKTINIVDVRCGNKMNKVLVCKPDKKGNNEFCLSDNQVLNALLSGAKLGSCDNGTQKTIEPGVTDAAIGISIFPNPNNGSFVVQLTKLNNVELRVRDQSGKIISRQSINGGNKVQQVTINLGKVQNGLYMVEAVGKEGVYAAKMLVRQ